MDSCFWRKQRGGNKNYIEVGGREWVGERALRVFRRLRRSVFFRLLWAFSPRRWSKQLRNTYLVSPTRRTYQQTGISSGSLKSGNCVPADENECKRTGKIFPGFAFHSWCRLCDSVCYFEAINDLREYEKCLRAAVGVRLISQKISPVCLHVAYDWVLLTSERWEGSEVRRVIFANSVYLYIYIIIKY